LSPSIRAIEHGELFEFFQAMSGPFAFDLPEDEDERSGWLDRIQTIFEPDRTRCAFEKDRLVGTLGAFSLTLAVPGGLVSCAGTTMVTVQTSHRRRGLLRQMMDAHLDDAEERGDVLAGLWASDSAIYRRFGFGMASVDVTIDIDRAHVAFGRLAPEPSDITVIGADEAEALIPRVYDRLHRAIPGMYALSDDWWKHRRLRDSPDRRGDYTKLRFAITGPVDDPTGYAFFRLKEGWGQGHGSHEVRVVDLLADDPADWAGLWRHVLDHDLASKITAVRRAEDDPLFAMLAGPRRARADASDGLWVRIMDVPAALEARKYLQPGHFTLGVHDPLHRAGGSFAVEISSAGTASCSSTSAVPDIDIDLEDLSSAYLGRSRLSALHRAGRLTGDAATVARVEQAFAWHRAPWCSEVF
jgi:predicted acetyltransferase